MNGEGMPESKCAMEGGTCSLTGSDFEDVDFFRHSAFNQSPLTSAAAPVVV